MSKKIGKYALTLLVIALLCMPQSSFAMSFIKKLNLFGFLSGETDELKEFDKEESTEKLEEFNKNIINKDIINSNYIDNLNNEKTDNTNEIVESKKESNSDEKKISDTEKEVEVLKDLTDLYTKAISNNLSVTTVVNKDENKDVLTKGLLNRYVRLVSHELRVLKKNKKEQVSVEELAYWKKSIQDGEVKIQLIIAIANSLLARGKMSIKDYVSGFGTRKWIKPELLIEASSKLKKAETKEKNYLLTLKQYPQKKFKKALHNLVLSCKSLQSKKKKIDQKHLIKI